MATVNRTDSQVGSKILIRGFPYSPLLSLSQLSFSFICALEKLKSIYPMKLPYNSTEIYLLLLLQFLLVYIIQLHQISGKPLKTSKSKPRYMIREDRLKSLTLSGCVQSVSCLSQSLRNYILKENNRALETILYMKAEKFRLVCQGDKQFPRYSNSSLPIIYPVSQRHSRLISFWKRPQWKVNNLGLWKGKMKIDTFLLKKTLKSSMKGKSIGGFPDS